jgi:hypothetical protein
VDFGHPLTAAFRLRSIAIPPPSSPRSIAELGETPGRRQTGKTVLRDYIDATVGFVELAEVTHRSPKRLTHMLGPKGNPQAQNLFAIISYLLDQEGMQFELRAAGVS